MPAAFAAPAILGTMSAIGAGATAAAGIYGANKQAGASQRATEAGLASTREAMEWEKEQDRLDRLAYDEAQRENRLRWDIEANRDERRWSLDQGRQRWQDATEIEAANALARHRQPYRDTSLAAVQSLAAKAGLTVRPTTPPQLSAPPATASPQYMADLIAATQPRATTATTTKARA